MVLDSNSRPRIAVCDCHCGRTEAVRAALPEAGFEVVPFGTSEILLERSLQRAPDVMLCRLGARCDVDPGILRLFRRISRGAPIVVISEGMSLKARRLAQEFRPIFFVLEPVDPVELRDTIDAALAQRTKRNPTRI